MRISQIWHHGFQIILYKFSTKLSFCPVRFEQVIGRAVRICSHEQLEEKEPKSEPLKAETPRIARSIGPLSEINDNVLRESKQSDVEQSENDESDDEPPCV